MDWGGLFMIMTLGGGLHELLVLALMCLLPVIIPVEIVSWWRRERRQRANNLMWWKLHQQYLQLKHEQLKDGGK